MQGFDLDFELLEAKSINLRDAEDWKRHFSDGKLLLKESQSHFRMPETWAFATTAKCTAMLKWRDTQRDFVQNSTGYVDALWEASEGLPSSYRKWLPHLGGSFTLWKATSHLVASDAVDFRPAEEWAFRHLDYMPDPWVLGPPLPLDYITDYAGGPMFALARDAKHLAPSSPGALMKLRRFERCALDGIIAYRSYATSSPLVQIYHLPIEPRWWPRKVGEAMAAFEAWDVVLQVLSCVVKAYIRSSHRYSSMLTLSSLHLHQGSESLWYFRSISTSLLCILTKDCYGYVLFQRSPIFNPGLCNHFLPAMPILSTEETQGYQEGLILIKNL